MSEYISGQTRQEVTSRGAVIQSDFFDDRIVFTGGLRKDFNRTRNANGAQINLNTGFFDNGGLGIYGPWTNATGLTRTAGVVVKIFPWWGVSYNQSSSFLPQPPAVDLDGNILPNTYGHDKEVGTYFNLIQNKLVVSLKLYKTNNINDRTSNATIASRIGRLEGGVSGATDSFSLINFATNQAQLALPNGTPAQIAAYINNITQFPVGFQNAAAANNSGAALRGTHDTAAKGAELELIYNPLPNWTIKFTGAQTKAVNTSIENSLAGYIAKRMPYWLSVKDAQGNPWWTSTALGSQSAATFYTVSAAVPLDLDPALLSKSNPQVKEYTWRMLTNYVFNEGKLKGFGVGGSARWDDKRVIGYLGSAPDPDGVIRSLHVNKPYYDPARYYFDFWVSYSMKLYHDRIRAKFQVNLLNA